MASRKNVQLDLPIIEDLSYIAVQNQKRRLKSSPQYTFTWIDIVIIFVSMCTFVADIVTDILVVLVYWKNDELSWAALTLVFFLIPAFIIQVFSIRWYVSDGREITWFLIFVHILMLGPLRRYISVLQHGFKARKSKSINDYQLMYCELSDISMLRLFECFLESAPQLVLQLHIMIRVEEDYVLTGISACFSLLSLSWAIVAYTRALRAAASERISLTGAALHSIWRGGMIMSRITAILMFATVFQEWTLLVLGLHWLIMTIWIFYQDTDFCKSWWEERLFNVIVGIIYVFCFFNLKEGKSRYRVAFYYTIALIENSMMILFWWPNKTVGKWYNVPALSVVWIAFAIGLVCMILYYLFFHPASKRRCHCCMAWRVITFMCQSKSCGRQNDTGSPYKKVHRNKSINSSDEAPCFDSSDEVDEDSTPVQHSHDSVTIYTDSTSHLKEMSGIDSTDNNLDESGGKIAAETSMASSANDTSADVETAELRNIVVVGDAMNGYQVKQVHSPVPNHQRNAFMSRPQLTSTPGDDLKCEANDLLVTPIKKHGPRSPNTLVKKWVKDTREFYKFKINELSLNVTDNNVHDPRSISLNKATNQRHNILRMKSFSKSDNLKQKPNFRPIKRKRSTLRNPFKVIDLDHNSEDSKNQGHVTDSPCKIVDPSSLANVIKQRIDQPPVFLIQSSDKENEPGISRLEIIAKSKDFSSAFTPDLDRPISGLSFASNPNPPLKERSNLGKTWRTDSSRGSARKKLTFKGILSTSSKTYSVVKVKNKS